MAQGLPGGVGLRTQKVDGREHWRAENTTPIVVSGMSAAGRWYLSMYWVVGSDPGDGSARLVESSIALNVESPLTDGRSTRCLVRYDVDHRVATNRTYAYSPAHINVLQPDGLEDGAHYPIVGGAIEEWPVADVVDFLTSDVLRDTLDARLPRP
jgi:hypothetical protein